MNDMPNIPTDGLSDEALAYIGRITVNGRLRASKPKVTRRASGVLAYGRRTYEPDHDEGCVAYVWRMVAFMVSPRSRHHCMPMTADFDLPGDCEARRVLSEGLDRIVNEIVDAVPKHQWHGIIRWGQVYGQIGTPRHDEHGAVIYR